jgi:hypothetical protein
MAIKIQQMLENVFNKLWRLVPSTYGGILTNKWVLYFIFVIGIFDVINFYQSGNITSVAIFFIVGFLTAFFSKNMIVVIVAAIAVTHLITYGNKVSEGLDEEDDEEEGFEEEEEEDKEGFEEGVDEEEEEDEGFEEGVDDETEDASEEKKKEEKTDSFVTNDQTNELLKKQKELMDNMNKLEPLLQKAENMIKNGSIKTEGFGGISSYSEYK